MAFIGLHMFIIRRTYAPGYSAVPDAKDCPKALA